MVGNTISGNIQSVGTDRMTINGREYYVDPQSKLATFIVATRQDGGPFFRPGQFVEATLKNGLLTFVKPVNPNKAAETQTATPPPARQMQPPNPNFPQGNLPPAGLPPQQGQAKTNQVPFTKDDYWRAKAMADEVRQVEIRANGLLNTAVNIYQASDRSGQGTLDETYQDVVKIADMLHQYVYLKVQEPSGSAPGTPSNDKSQKPDA